MWWMGKKMAQAQQDYYDCQRYSRAQIGYSLSNYPWHLIQLGDTMNDHEQIEIIQAHTAGKKVLCFDQHPDATSDEWLEVAKGNHHFNFQRYQYRIEPRKVECFIAISNAMVTQLLTMYGPLTGHVEVSNHPFTPGEGRKLVKISFAEPV